MSRTIKNEKTKGALDRLERERKERRLIRCLKADLQFCEIEYLLPHVSAA